MRKKNVILIYCLTLMLTISVSVGHIWAQEKYPTRAIDIIVPYGPGGSTDLVTRIVGDYLKNQWNVPINTINKPGGLTVPGTLEVYKATPDGYTLLADCPGSSSLLEVAAKGAPIQVMDRTFIAMITSTPMVLIVPTSSPFKTLADLVAVAKKAPEKVTWASAGGTTGQDIMSRQFLQAAGIDVMKTRPVVAESGGRAVTLTSGGNVLFGAGTPAVAGTALRDGNVRGLAVSGTDRYPDLPDIPTFAEQGYPSVNAVWWIGISGPPNTPKHVFEAWDAALKKMAKDADVIARLKRLGAIPNYLNSGDMRAHVMREKETMAKLWGAK